MATQQAKIATQQASDVADAAAAVLVSVPLTFLFVAFFLAVASVIGGLFWVACISFNQGFNSRNDSLEIKASTCRRCFHRRSQCLCAL